MKRYIDLITSEFNVLEEDITITKNDDKVILSFDADLVSPITVTVYDIYAFVDSTPVGMEGHAMSIARLESKLGELRF